MPNPRKKKYDVAATTKATAALSAAASVTKKTGGTVFDNFNAARRSFFDRFNTRT